MSNYTAVTDRLDISTETKTETEVLRNYLRSDPADDMIVELIYEATKKKADSYMKNDFTDDDGDELEIPADVKLWVMQMVARKYNRRANGTASESEEGIGSITWSEEETMELNKYRTMGLPKLERVLTTK